MVVTDALTIVTSSGYSNFKCVHSVQMIGITGNIMFVKSLLCRCGRFKGAAVDYTTRSAFSFSLGGF